LTSTWIFLGALLLQVKDVIRKERHLSAIETRKVMNKLRSGTGGNPAAGPTKAGGVVFPPLNVKGANMHLMEPRNPSELQAIDVQKVRTTCGGGEGEREREKRGIFYNYD
jgi:hypothetical protein